MPDCLERRGLDREPDAHPPARYPTIREVRLLGRSRRVPAEGLRTGQEITWLGREYRVIAVTHPGRNEARADRLGDGVGRSYVHLATLDDGAVI